jgi:hypothetical protein
MDYQKLSICQIILDNALNVSHNHRIKARYVIIGYDWITSSSNKVSNLKYLNHFKPMTHVTYLNRLSSTLLDVLFFIRSWISVMAREIIVGQIGE